MVGGWIIPAGATAGNGAPLFVKWSSSCIRAPIVAAFSANRASSTAGARATWATLESSDLAGASLR